MPTERRRTKFVHLHEPFDRDAPIIWRSPYRVRKGSHLGRMVVVLVDGGTEDRPEPLTSAAFLPDEDWERLPWGVVEY
jgi:hypothetical protein